MRLHQRTGRLFSGLAVVFAGPRRTKAEPGVYRLHPQAPIVGIGCLCGEYLDEAIRLFQLTTTSSLWGLIFRGQPRP